MFSSSVRRVICTAQSTPITQSISSKAGRSTVAKALAFRPAQRRYSSSKPSGPTDGSKGIEGGHGIPSAPCRANDEKKVSAKGGKRKAKDVANESAVKGKDEMWTSMPSVPTTQHLSDKEIATSTFFSLSRPISVTSTFPKPVSDEAFAQIFAARTKEERVQDTISNWTEELEAKLEAASGVREVFTEEPDSSNAPFHSNAPFPKPLFARGSVLPYQVPPPPKPMDSAQSLRAGKEAAEASKPQHRTYTAVLTIEESTDANGEVKFVASHSPFVMEEPPATPVRFLERMKHRQEQYNEYRERRAEEEGGIWAISVKRQRKLKMKKHKYKKLMRKQRNLRRRLDRN